MIGRKLSQTNVSPYVLLTIKESLGFNSLVYSSYRVPSYLLVSPRSVLPELVPEGGAVLDAEDAGAEGARQLDAGGGAGGGAALGHARDRSGAGDAEHAVGVAEEATAGAVPLVA